MKKSIYSLISAIILTTLTLTFAQPTQAGPVDPKKAVETAKEIAKIAENGNIRKEIDMQKLINSSEKLHDKIIDDFIDMAQRIIDTLNKQDPDNPTTASPELTKLINQYMTHEDSNGFTSITQSVPWMMTRFMIWGTSGIDEKFFAKTVEENAALVNAQKNEIITELYKALLGSVAKKGETTAQAEEKVKKTVEYLKAQWADYLHKIEGMRSTSAVNNNIKIVTPVEPEAVKELLSAKTKNTVNTAVSAGTVMANKLEDINAQGGLPGLSGEAKDTSLFMKTRMIGIILLILGFFARIVQMVIGRLIGNSPSNEMKTLGTVIKFMCLLVLILSISSIVEIGMNISDSARAYILDPENKMPDAGVGEKTVAVLQMIDSMADARQKLLGGGQTISLADWISTKLQAGIAWVLYIGIAAVVIAIMAMCDIMMGITGVMAPICFAVSFFPHCGQWFDHIVRGWIGYVIQLPIVAIFLQIMIILLAMTTQVGFVTFLIVSMVYIMSASKIPQLAASLSAAVVTGVVAGIAGMPASAAKGAGSLTIRAVGGGALGLAGKAVGSMIRNIIRK